MRRGINEQVLKKSGADVLSCRKNSTPSGVATTPSPLRVNTYWNEFKCLPSNLRAGVDL